MDVADPESGRRRELNIPEVQEFITALRSRIAEGSKVGKAVWSISGRNGCSGQKASGDGAAVGCGVGGGADRLMNIPILYQGRLGDLYPEIADAPDWNDRLLERFKSDSGHLGMELDEPLCNGKVPREGICIRIMNDPVSECFKLKTLRVLGKEAELIDKGEIDLELSQG